MAGVESMLVINAAAVGRVSSDVRSDLAVVSSARLLSPVSCLVLSVALAARSAHAFTTRSRSAIPPPLG